MIVITTHTPPLPNVGLMLGQCGRWWANIEPPPGESIVFVVLSTGRSVVSGLPRKATHANQCWFNVGPASWTLGQHKPALVQHIVLAGHPILTRDVVSGFVECWASALC